MAGRLRFKSGVRGRSRRQLVAGSTPVTATVPSTVFTAADEMASPPLQWQEDPDTPPAAPELTGHRELHLPSATEMSPLDVVRLFLDDEFFAEFVSHTSEYTRQCLAGSSGRRTVEGGCRRPF